jgi:hypothetical protein
MTAYPSFTCPECSAVSYSTRDIENGYCGACHDFTGTTLAEAFRDYFAAVDEVIDAITPEETERRIAELFDAENRETQ